MGKLFAFWFMMNFNCQEIQCFFILFFSLVSHFKTPANPETMHLFTYIYLVFLWFVYSEFYLQPIWKLGSPQCEVGIGFPIFLTKWWASCLKRNYWVIPLFSTHLKHYLYWKIYSYILIGRFLEFVFCSTDLSVYPQYKATFIFL